VGQGRVSKTLHVICTNVVGNFVGTMKSLTDILKIGDKIKEKWGRQFYKHVDFCGLEPVNISDYRYESTPINTEIFATTGGDGVHFSLLTNNIGLTDKRVVIMTVPMVDKNIILADSFDEFLGLGYYNGWFPLEQLANNFNDAIDYYSTPDNSLTLQQRNFLDFMRTEFDIVHSPLTKKRLEILERLYTDKLIFNIK
jgi:hypothetical protein